jgi:hypothetical protein
VSWGKHIRAVGIELEGGFTAEDCMTADVYGDASVELDLEFQDEYTEAGEIQSPPCQSPDQLDAFLADNFPSITNSSCGVHVHFSTNTIEEYNVALSRQFYDGVIGTLRAYGEANRSMPRHYFSRLNGDNEYCEDLYQPRRQLEGDGRYAIVNYCFGKHGTCEIRVLPAFSDRSQLFDTICHLIAWVDNYIEDHAEEAAVLSEHDVTMNSAIHPTRIRRRFTLKEKK